MPAPGAVFLGNKGPRGPRSSGRGRVCSDHFLARAPVPQAKPTPSGPFGGVRISVFRRGVTARRPRPVCDVTVARGVGGARACRDPEAGAALWRPPVGFSCSIFSDKQGRPRPPARQGGATRRPGWCSWACCSRAAWCWARRWSR